MVPPYMGTRIRFFLAVAPALRIAAGTSLALPNPNPTCPSPPPTTTSALKLNRRPLFTTLATRLTWTSFSVRFKSAGFILSVCSIIPKTSILLCEPHQPELSLDRDIYILHGRRQLGLPLCPGHALPPMSPPTQLPLSFSYPWNLLLSQHQA